MTNLDNLTVGQLRKVVAIKEKIEKLRAELDSFTEGDGAAPVRRRHMSAAGRARIAAAQRKRWAKVKGNRGSAAKPVKKAKRRVSRATRVRLAALAKARWANAKAAGKSRL